MTYKIKSRDEHLAADGRPKRILALDGGGLRGILTIGILQRIEDILRASHGGSADFRLCHYFDLIAGTSTGAIMAAALAQGWTVEQLRSKYLDLGARVFEKSLFRLGMLRAKYDKDLLVQELKAVYGADTLLRDPALITGLLVVAKRLDTGSAWALANNPRGKFFAGDPATGMIGNGDYPLWQVVRASTAAPRYFDPEQILITSKEGRFPVVGEFVDGGVSPYNNPALQALMYATLDGYRVGWPMGEDRMLLVSVGTGSKDPSLGKSSTAATHAIGALVSVLEDCAAMQQMLLQWLSRSGTARPIDLEVGDLRDDLLGGRALLSYYRYDVELTPVSVRALAPEMRNLGQIKSLSEMDSPQNMGVLHHLGVQAGLRDVDEAHFSPTFALQP
jgi:uncharacterized protein